MCVKGLLSPGRRDGVTVQGTAGWQWHRDCRDLIVSYKAHILGHIEISYITDTCKHYLWLFWKITWNHLTLVHIFLSPDIDIPRWWSLVGPQFNWKQVVAWYLGRRCFHGFSGRSTATDPLRPLPTTSVSGLGPPFSSASRWENETEKEKQIADGCRDRWDSIKMYQIQLDKIFVLHDVSWMWIRVESEIAVPEATESEDESSPRDDESSPCEGEEKQDKGKKDRMMWRSYDHWSHEDALRCLKTDMCPDHTAVLCRTRKRRKDLAPVIWRSATRRRRGVFLHCHRCVAPKSAGELLKGVDLYVGDLASSHQIQMVSSWASTLNH